MSNLQTLGDVLTLGLALFAAVFIPYLVIRAWVFPHAHEIGNALARGWSFLWAKLSQDTITSNNGDGTGELKPVDGHDGQPAQKSNHPIAMGDNTDNNQLSVNPGDAGAVNTQSDIIPNQAREIIRFQAKAEAIADLLKAGLLTNQAKAIETVYQCSRTSSSRPDTPYQKARRLIEQLAHPKPVFYDDLQAEIEAEVHAEEEPVR